MAAQEGVAGAFNQDFNDDFDVYRPEKIMKVVEIDQQMGQQKGNNTE